MATGVLHDKSHIDRAAPRHANRSTMIGDYAAPAVEVGQPTEPFRSGGVLLLLRGRTSARSSAELTAAASGVLDGWQIDRVIETINAVGPPTTTARRLR